jgi:hypothetical protein
MSINFEQRRSRALTDLAHISAHVQQLADVLSRVVDIRQPGDGGWHAWSRNIEGANDALRCALAEVSRSAVL